jgi:uncharacterized protein (TIGR02246 family)
MRHRPNPAASLRLSALALACVCAAACGNGAAGGAAAGSAAPPASNAAADEAAIRALDSAWTKSAGDKNVDAFATYYATDGVLMAPGEAMLKGRDAIHAALAGMVKDPNFALTFTPDQVTPKGDLAWEIGHYTITFSDKAGKPAPTSGKYVVVWARQADGSWKAVLDAPTTTQ